MKYIDPSYQIRAVPTNCNDRIYCKVAELPLVWPTSHPSLLAVNLRALKID